MSGKALLAVVRASRPTCTSRVDKLAFAVHAGVLVNGYRLVAVGPGTTDDAPPSDAPECDVQGWNSQPGEYTFKYAPEAATGSGLLVKALTMDSLLLVSFLSYGDADNPQTLELDSGHFTSDAPDPAAALPHLDELAAKIDSVLGPPASKAQAASTSQAGEATTSATSTEGPSRGRAPPDHRNDPLREPDYPLRVGGTDLDPLGLHSPGGPGFPGGYGGIGGIGGVGGIGGYPPRGPAGGGMHVGPGHPYFQEQLRRPGVRPPGMQPPGLPPGARWDPIRPPGMEGFNPEDFQRQPGRRRDLDDVGPPPGQGGADWDHMFG